MQKKKIPSWLKHWDFEILDIICIEVAFLVAYVFRHPDEYQALEDIYLKMGGSLFMIGIIVAIVFQGYKGILHRNKWQEITAVIRHVTLVYTVFLIYEYLLKEAEVLSRTVYLLGWGISLVLCYGIRVIWKKIVRRRLVTERIKHQVMLITSEQDAQKSLEELYKKLWHDFEITCIGVVEERSLLTGVQGIPVVCGRDAVIENIRQQVVDEVIIEHFQDNEELSEWVDLFLNMGITTHVSLGFLPEHMPNKHINKIGDTYVVTTSIRMVEGWEVVAKRIMDIAGGMVGLLIAGVAYLFVAPAMQLADPGSVFFKQERVGKNGRPFYIYKFRSMYMDAEERKKELMKYNEMQGLMFKMENDPRIIGSEKGPGKGLGNFLRKTSIDELPQFWNILKGDMSLVGTRPPTKKEYEQYELHHKIRLSQKPGLTGLWQVSGRSDITDFEEVVKLDAEYIENWSLKYDIKILLKTVKVVLTRSGSR